MSRFRRSTKKKGDGHRWSSSSTDSDDGRRRRRREKERQKSREKVGNKDRYRNPLSLETTGEYEQEDPWVRVR